MPADSSAMADAGSPKSTDLHAFISYARADSVSALRLQRELEQGGQAVFLDTSSVRSGELWPDALRDAIHACNRFWLLWSKQAAESAWVKLEYTEALALRKQWQLERFIQIRRLDTTPLPASLATTQAEPPTRPHSYLKAVIPMAAALVIVAAAAIAIVSRRENPGGKVTAPVAIATNDGQITNLLASTAMTSSGTPTVSQPRPDPTSVSSNGETEPTQSAESVASQTPPGAGQKSNGVIQNVEVGSVDAKGRSKVVAGKIESTSSKDIRQNVSAKSVRASDRAQVEIGVIKQ